MSEMLDRIAKAICCPDGCRAKIAADCGSYIYCQEAAAVLKAMPEPTKPMLDAYMGALEAPLPEGDKRYPYYRMKAVKRYNAMIRAAVK